MPNRMLRTQALTSRRLGAVSAEAEALYYRLMLVADDYGRYHGEADLVQSATYPRGERRIDEAFKELVRCELLHLYEHERETYLEFETWDQSVRAKESRYPQPQTDVDGRTSSAPEVEVEVEVGDEDVRELVRASDSFDEFWSIYPRRAGKRAARAAFEKALKRVPASTIIAGAASYSADPNREAKFTAHPTTWLNRDGWEDDPLPARDASGEMAQIADELRARGL